MNKQNNICFVAGKTGGHILPCLTLAEQYKSSFAPAAAPAVAKSYGGHGKISGGHGKASDFAEAMTDRSADKQDNPESNVIFFSTNAQLDTSILANQPIISQHITLPLGRFSPTRIRRYLQLAWGLIHSFVTSLYHLRKNNTEKVISTGGLVALPVCLAAMFLRIPIELYELNAVPGKAIKALAPIAQIIYVCFAQAADYFPKNKCVYKPYPVRFNHEHTQMSKELACKELDLDPHKKTLFIMGGSQGSVQLNNEIKKYIETSSHTNNLQIIHQTGSHDQTDWHSFYANNHVPALVFAYRDAIAPCYVAADLIISRAGAGMLFEILFFEKPSIIIPLEAKTTSHQLDNAYAMKEQYPTLFTVIRQNQLTHENALFHHLDNLLETEQVPTKKSCAQKNPAQSEV